jgi:hypothetical protein
MAPTDNSKCGILREMAHTCFPEEEDVVAAMRRAEELADQLPADTVAFVAVTEVASRPRRGRGSARRSWSSTPDRAPWSGRGRRRRLERTRRRSWRSRRRC